MHQRKSIVATCPHAASHNVISALARDLRRHKECFEKEVLPFAFCCSVKIPMAFRRHRSAAVFLH